MKIIKEKTKHFKSLSFATPEQLKTLLIQFKKGETATSFINKAIKEMIDKLENVDLLIGDNLKHISITRPPEEIEEKMINYITVERLFTSRGSLISSAILHKILNQIPVNKKVKIDNKEEILTVEEYLEKNNLKIIGVA